MCLLCPESVVVLCFLSISLGFLSACCLLAGSLVPPRLACLAWDACLDFHSTEVFCRNHNVGLWGLYVSTRALG